MAQCNKANTAICKDFQELAGLVVEENVRNRNRAA